MQMSPKSSRMIVALVMVCATVAVATSALAEIIVLDCEANKSANICPSRWVIDTDANTVIRHWCNDPDSAAPGSVVITEENITFDDGLTGSYYEINRKTGRMTILGDSYDGMTHRKYNGGETVCHTPGK